VVFVGLVGILQWGLAATPEQWLSQKIYRQSPDGARRFYRRIDRASPRIPS
jgi:hypothetical protein